MTEDAPLSSSTMKPSLLMTRTYQTERGGAKCDCVCTCKRPESPKNVTTNN